jgi:hypothetical protein
MLKIKQINFKRKSKKILLKLKKNFVQKKKIIAAFSTKKSKKKKIWYLYNDTVSMMKKLNFSYKK